MYEANLASIPEPIRSKIRQISQTCAECRRDVNIFVKLFKDLTKMLIHAVACFISRSHSLVFLFFYTCIIFVSISKALTSTNSSAGIGKKEKGKSGVPISTIAANRLELSQSLLLIPVQVRARRKRKTKKKPLQARAGEKNESFFSSAR